MSAADQILAEKANRCLPAGIKAFAQFPMPWQDEDGDWHEPLPDTVVIRIRHDPISDGCWCVDAMLHEGDALLSDQYFSERFIKPMLAALKSHRSNGESP